jgi:hypothetical protein
MTDALVAFIENLNKLRKKNGFLIESQYGVFEAYWRDNPIENVVVENLLDELLPELAEQKVLGAYDERDFHHWIQERAAKTITNSNVHALLCSHVDDLLATDKKALAWKFFKSFVGRDYRIPVLLVTALGTEVSRADVEAYRQWPITNREAK